MLYFIFVLRMAQCAQIIQSHMAGKSTQEESWKTIDPQVGSRMVTMPLWLGIRAALAKRVSA